MVSVCCAIARHPGQALVSARPWRAVGFLARDPGPERRAFRFYGAGERGWRCAAATGRRCGAAGGRIGDGPSPALPPDLDQQAETPKKQAA